MKQAVKTQRLLAEINLDNIVANYQQAQKCANGRDIYCVVKADAYGHGAVPVTRALVAAGATHFAVATPEEALQLRRHGISQDILLLGMVDAAWAKTLAKQEIALAVGSTEVAEEYAAAAAGKRLKLHIKLDSGMARIGFAPSCAVAEILALAQQPCFELAGLFTHFSAADDPAENDFTQAQMARFIEVSEELQRRGLHIPLLHCAGSAAIIAHPYTHAALVRPGLMLYGSSPLSAKTVLLLPTLSLRARVSQVLPVRQGQSVGYGRAWYAARDSVIATLTIGYADGLTRLLSNKLPVLIRGQQARQVGRICMDMCMIDVTEVENVRVGDYATIIGTDGDLTRTVDEVAQAAQTIPHEIFCAIGARVPRLYYQKGKLVEQTCYIDNL